MKRTFFLALAALSMSVSAQIGMDHINPVGADLVSTPANGRTQVFSDTPELSRMVIDDFLADGSVVGSASYALEFQPNDIGHPDGWRISFWNSIADAATSGDDFTQNTVATAYVEFSDTANWLLTPLDGTGAGTQAYRLDLLNLNLNIGSGVRYIGIAPVQGSTVAPNWYILDHKNPAVLGNFTPNNSFGVNPSGALGLGTSYSIGTNAAYQVNLVPEPGTLLAVASALAFLVKRRRH